MGHLPACTLLFLLPSLAGAQAPAAPAAPAGSPLLSLNVPNPLTGLDLGSLLGNLLGGLLGMGNNAGTPTNPMGLGNVLSGNMFGLSNMVGLFHHNSNMQYHQLMMHGLMGMATLKITVLVVMFGLMFVGSLLVKLSGLALALSLVRFGQFDPHPYRRSRYNYEAPTSHPWPSQRLPMEDSFLWGVKRIS